MDIPNDEIATMLSEKISNGNPVCPHEYWHKHTFTADPNFYGKGIYRVKYSGECALCNATIVQIWKTSVIFVGGNVVESTRGEQL